MNTTNKKTISVIIPAKNEGIPLKKLLPRIKQLDEITEIIVVDDGSSDDTREIGLAAGANVISHPYSMGNGAAIKTGTRSAQGELLLFMDADGQHNPDDIPRLIRKLDEGYDMTVGARQKGSQASRGRGFANWLYNHLSSWMTNHKIDDLTSGFRIVRAKKFREFLHLLPNGFSYPTTSTMAFFRAGYAVAYVPIHAAQRTGKSHIKPFRDGVRFLLIIFRIGTLYSPLKLFLPISLFHFFLGTGYYLYTFITAGRFTNMSALLFSTSIIIFLIGLVSEQITGLLFRDSNK
ncbi:glycosyl transferase [Solemya pervernicosa gill symbiont]|uniref:Glycosyl transferase n=1 Tax=Solemya pervernicosa gill symbiont TaxID=642797 RepID=A0A1T2L9S1_9GAMM|nr:glycosyltransferase family 2 protein [Solemya pervernicosa gill symbiont]OOZ41820.1 glycosyl transferase [Solemya pervernicosa gill symbiont]